MAKLDLLHLRNRIGREEFDHYQLVSALSQYRAKDQKINELIKSEAIIRVKKGLYIFGPELTISPASKETLANLVYGPSCISLEYALSFHGLTPERVEAVTSVTPNRDKLFDTPVGRFTYRYLNGSKYPHGIEQQWIDKQHPILIASPEKAMCDYLLLNRVPLLSSPNACKSFLEEDLRIDPDNWKRFDLKALIQLNRYYNSPNLARIMEVL